MSITVFDKEDNVHKLQDESYNDIRNELLKTENDYIIINNAIIENGVVCLNGEIKTNIKGYNQDSMIPLKYSPRLSIYGTINYSADQNDNNKIQNLSINSSGIFRIWIREALNYNEVFSIMYSLKNE